MNKFLKLIKSGNQEFKNTFKAIGSNHVYKNRKTIVKSIALCFIPFLYAFITLWAFFNPLGNINKLPIALVNGDTYSDVCDNNNDNDNRIINLHNLNLDGVAQNKYGAYQFNINDLQISNEKKTFTVYYYDNDKTYQQHKNDKTFLTEIIVDKNFTKDFNLFFNEALKIVENNITTPEKIWKLINQIPNRPQISLEASYKVNPILGEINDFALNTLKNSIFSKFLPVVISDQLFDYWYHNASSSSDGYKKFKPIFKTMYGFFSIVVPGLGPHADEFNTRIDEVNSNDKIIVAKMLEHNYWMNHELLEPLNFIDFNINIEGQDKSPYGFGLGPYFMCIGMWVGTLLLTFTFIRDKDLSKSKFWSNYLGKSTWMVMFGIVQSIILTTSLLLLFHSADLWSRCWQLLLYMLCIGIVFDLVVQSIAHMFRNHDLGRFLVVILLILQLSSSSGTFPVELEPGFFQAMYHVLPFSYAIKALREILINPNALNILWSLGCLLLFVIILVPLSLLANWRYDKRDVKQLESKLKNNKSETLVIETNNAFLEEGE